MIISFKLLGYCMLFGAVYLLIIDWLWSRLERIVPTLSGFPAELVEPKTVGWFFSNYIVEFIFFVFMPAVVYGWFYTVIPFSGIRGGVATGLFLFIFGMIPFSLLTMFRIRIPLVYISYQLLGLLIKVIGTLGIIGYLYSL